MKMKVPIRGAFVAVAGLEIVRHVHAGHSHHVDNTDPWDPAAAEVGAFPFDDDGRAAAATEGWGG